MPPRLGSNDTTVAGPSGHGGGLSGAVGRLHSDPLGVRNLLAPIEMPIFEGKTLTAPKFQVLYAAWNWYLVGLRQLLPEEVQGMATIYCRTKHPTRKALALFNRLDNPKYSTEIRDALEPLTKPEKQRLLDKAHELFEELKKDPGAQARSKQIEGFQGRLSKLPYLMGTYGLTRIRNFDGHILQAAQFYQIFSILNWLKDSEGNNITRPDALEVVNDYYEYNITLRRFSTLIRHLKNPDHPLNEVVTIIMMEPRHREFFGNKALELYSDYTSRKGLPAPHLDIPTDDEDIDEENSDDESEPEPTTTTGMKTLSLTTTAPGLSVPSARGPSRSAERYTPQSEIDSHYFNEAFHEGRSIEASPSPSGTGSKDTSKKGKGRERQSDSPGEGSGKAKEKRPRRGGK